MTDSANSLTGTPGERTDPQLAISSLIQANGSFTEEGDIAASTPVPGLIQRRQRWNGLAAHHALEARKATELARQHVTANLIVTACCMRAWFAGQELLERAWAGEPTKSGVDKESVFKIVAFNTKEGGKARSVRILIPRLLINVSAVTTSHVGDRPGNTAND